MTQSLMHDTQRKTWFAYSGEDSCGHSVHVPLESESASGTLRIAAANGHRARMLYKLQPNPLPHWEAALAYERTALPQRLTTRRDFLNWGLSRKEIRTHLNSGRLPGTAAWCSIRIDASEFVQTCARVVRSAIFDASLGTSNKPNFNPKVDPQPRSFEDRDAFNPLLEFLDLPKIEIDPHMPLPDEWRGNDLRQFAAWRLLPLHRKGETILALCPSPASFGEHWSAIRQVLGGPYRLVRTQDDPLCHDWLVNHMADRWYGDLSALQTESQPWEGSRFGLPPLPHKRQMKFDTPFTQLSCWALSTLNATQHGRMYHPHLKMAGLLVAQACDLGMTGIRITAERSRLCARYLHRSQVFGACYFPLQFHGPLALVLGVASGMTLEKLPESEAGFEIQRNARIYRIYTHAYLEEHGECLELRWNEKEPSRST